MGDRFHVGKVLVEDRLAVLDFGGQPTCGDRIPSLGFGNPTCGDHDELATGSAVSFATLLDGHIRF